VLLASAAFWFFKKQAEHVVQGGRTATTTSSWRPSIASTTPAMHDVMEAITQLGSHTAITIAAGATAVMMWRNGRRQDAWTVAVSASPRDLLFARGSVAHVRPLPRL